MPRNLGVPHFRSAELLQARLEKGDLVRIGRVSPRPIETTWGLTVPPAVAASWLPAPPRPPLRGALATYPPRQRLSPVRPRVASFSLGSGYDEPRARSGACFCVLRRAGGQAPTRGAGPLPGVRCQLRGGPAAPSRAARVDRAGTGRQLVWSEVLACSSRSVSWRSPWLSVQGVAHCLPGFRPVHV